MDAPSFWPLLGIVVVVVGFVLRLNPLLVVAASALTTGVAAGIDLPGILAAFGKAFNESRYVSVIFVVLPIIGLLERYGLQERARSAIMSLKGATTGRLLLGYMMFRQATAALGLLSIAGQAQTVRPLVAPMAEGAAEARRGELTDDERQQIRAHAAATDNVAVFFGEDIFLAVSSILLIKGFLDQNGIDVSPFHLSKWAIPTAIAALLVHGARLLRMDATRWGRR